MRTPVLALISLWLSIAGCQQSAEQTSPSPANTSESSVAPVSSSEAIHAEAEEESIPRDTGKVQVEAKELCRTISVLQFAVMECDVEVVRSLVDNGADVNRRNSVGRTPLMYAAMQGRVDNVKLLLEKGADVNALAPNGVTALSLAAYNGRREVVKILKEAGAVINAEATPPIQTLVLGISNESSSPSAAGTTSAGADVRYLRYAGSFERGEWFHSHNGRRIELLENAAIPHFDLLPLSEEIWEITFEHECGLDLCGETVHVREDAGVFVGVSYADTDSRGTIFVKQPDESMVGTIVRGLPLNRAVITGIALKPAPKQ